MCLELARGGCETIYAGSRKGLEPAAPSVVPFAFNLTDEDSIRTAAGAMKAKQSQAAALFAAPLAKAARAVGALQTKLESDPSAAASASPAADAADAPAADQATADAVVDEATAETATEAPAEEVSTEEATTETPDAPAAETAEATETTEG